MGWRELRTWLRIMNKQLAPGADDPGSWEGRDSDAFWQEMDRKRKERRGW